MKYCSMLSVLTFNTVSCKLFQIAKEMDDNTSKVHNEFALQIRRIVIRLYGFASFKSFKPYFKTTKSKLHWGVQTSFF